MNGGSVQHVKCRIGWHSPLSYLSSKMVHYLDLYKVVNHRVVCTINSLRSSDAYLCWWPKPSLDLIMGWSAPNHYQNQCWNIVNWTPRNKLQWKFNRNSYIFNQENALENVVCKMAAILSGPQCVKMPGFTGPFRSWIIPVQYDTCHHENSWSMWFTWSIWGALVGNLWYSSLC